MDRPHPVIGLQDRILVVKLADIGDAVLSLPAIQAIRANRPDARIDVLTTDAGANVFQLSPAVDQIMTLAKQQFDHIRGLVSFTGALDLIRLTRRLRAGRYDAVIVLHHLTTAFGTRKFQALSRVAAAPVIAGLDNGRGRFLTHRAIDYGFGAEPEWRYGLDVCESIGLPVEVSRPELEISERDRRSADRLVDKSLGDPEKRFAVIHTEVGEFSPARAWRDDSFAAVARYLRTREAMPVILVGVDRHRPGLREISEIEGVHNLVSATSFPELCRIVDRASLVIGCDSSVAHLAGAFDRPSITLFGPSNIDAWRPFGAQRVRAGQEAPAAGKSIALHRDMPCAPCIYTGFRLGRPQGCRSRDCMMQLDPDDVIGLASTLLGRDSRAG